MGSKLVKFSVQAFPAARVIGKSARVPVDLGVDDRTIQDLWASLVSDGSQALLLSMPGRLSVAPDLAGWMGDFQPGGDAYTYVAGVLFQPGAVVPEGFVSREIAAGEMAVGWIQESQGEDGGDMMANASGHVGKAMQENGYEFDGSRGFFEMEVYSQERFRGPQGRGEKALLDFYSPCKKVS